MPPNVWHAAQAHTVPESVQPLAMDVNLANLWKVRKPQFARIAMLVNMLLHKMLITVRFAIWAVLLIQQVPQNV
jgi:hypothetical protein